jgi:hypothetical protein
MASMAMVRTAPAKRSLGVFSPVTTARVKIETELHLGNRLGLVGVRGVPLLPEELGGAQEHPRAQLPAHDVGPLVEQQRQIAVRADPLGHHLADDGLGRGPHDERFLELLAAGVGDHGELGCEALEVLGLAGQVALGDEQREVGVLVAGLFDATVELRLQQLPDAVPVGTDDHGALGWAPVDQLSLDDHLVVPGGEVLIR